MTTAVKLDAEALFYVQMKRWPHKMQGNQIVVEVCPYCGKDGYHFYINQENGLWDCKVCAVTGNLYRLLRDQGDLEKHVSSGERRYSGGRENKADAVPESLIDFNQAALRKNGAALEYLASRGISEKTIREYRLGYRKTVDGKGGMIGIPTFANGKCVVLKWRTLPPLPKTFRREPEGAASPLFNQDCIKSGEPVYLCEGEIDTLTLIQAGYIAVGTTTGAGGMNPAWLPYLKKASRVYVCYDGDPAGKVGAEKMALAVGKSKAYNVVLPDGEDVNSFVNVRGPAAFQKLVDEAKPFGQPMCLTSDDVMEEYLLRESAGEVDAIYTGFKLWDDFVGPLRRGNMDLLLGYQGTGKTSLATVIAWSLAQKHRVWYVSFELTQREQHDVVASHILGIPSDKLTKADRLLAHSHIQPSGFRFFNPGNLLDWRPAIEAIHEAVKENEIDVLIVDNLHYLTRVEKSVTEVEGVASKMLKGIAHEARIPVLLLHHPNKPTLEEKEPEIWHSRGSSSVLNDCSNVVILHRPLITAAGEQNQDRYEGGTLKRGKARWGRGGRIHIKYDGARRRFEQITFDEYQEIVPIAASRAMSVRRLPIRRGGADYAAGDND